MSTHARHSRSRSRRALAVPVVLLLALSPALFSACGQAASTAAGSGAPPTAPVPTTITLDGLPPRTLDGYRFAEANSALLEQIPCYCGCGNSVGHRFLRDCFLHDDGTYEAHASGCGICLAEFEDVALMLDRGESTAAIRAFIDARYADTGTPTDTPPVDGS